VRVAAISLAVLLFGVPKVTADVGEPPAVVPHAKLARAASLYHRERRKVLRLAHENRRLRARPPSPFTPADTRLAAELVGMVGGWPVAGALRVSWCESHHQPGAANVESIGSSFATGSWQVLYPSTWLSTRTGRRFPSAGVDGARNPYLNAWAAYDVWRRHGGSFVEWADVCARQG
jgi:hypothetical protein